LVGDALPLTDDTPFIAPNRILVLVILVPVLVDLFRTLLLPKVVLVLPGLSISVLLLPKVVLVLPGLSFSILDFAGQMVWIVRDSF
jgi:hypothetical protein